MLSVTEQYFNFQQLSDWVQQAAERWPRWLRLSSLGNSYEGRPLWCIAATHDIGFERDQRNNGVTHKIDPAIDGEREYVDGTLSETGLVVQRDHATPTDALTTAKTATGGEFHSDGRIVVLVLKNSTAASN